MKAVARARAQALCSAYPCTEKPPEPGLTRRSEIAVSKITRVEHRIAHKCRAGTALYSEAPLKLVRGTSLLPVL